MTMKTTSWSVGAVFGGETGGGTGVFSPELLRLRKPVSPPEITDQSVIDLSADIIHKTKIKKYEKLQKYQIDILGS
jgi:hypothetical protein